MTGVMDELIAGVEARIERAKKRPFPPTWNEVKRLVAAVKELQDALSETTDVLMNAADILEVLLLPQPPEEAGAEAHDQWTQARMTAMEEGAELLDTLEDDEDGDDEDDEDDDDAEAVPAE